MLTLPNQRRIGIDQKIIFVFNDTNRRKFLEAWPSCKTHVDQRQFFEDVVFGLEPTSLASKVVVVFIYAPRIQGLSQQLER